MKKNIAILGGGISGLSAAFLLLKKIPGITVHLYEKTDSVGGALSSHKLHFRENSWLELGPSSIRKSKQINELMKIISETDLLPKSF
jgi:oxygen-dependent protoporphyrinogen oxidase